MKAKLIMNIPVALKERINEWRHAERIETTTEAVIVLLEAALTHAENRRLSHGR